MAWNNAVVTNSGVALLQQVLAGGTLTIDGAAGGTGTVLPGVLMAQTSLKNQKQAFSVVGATNVTNGKKVNILVSNADLSTGYTMQQVGIWAHVGEGSSVLFAILQDDTGIAIPSESDIPDFALNFYAVVDFSNESDFALAVDPSALVSFGMLTEAVSDAINEAKGYTDSVVATIDISSKLDKTGNGSDVTAAFTQAETRTNIATGEKLSVLFGKIKKWFADLGSAAFKDVGVVGGVAGHDALTSHLADIANKTDAAKGAALIGMKPITGLAGDNVRTAISNLFTFANDGKTGIANAVTAKGVAASPSDTFATLATKIGQINTEPFISVQTGFMDGLSPTEINTTHTFTHGLGKTPSVVVVTFSAVSRSYPDRVSECSYVRITSGHIMEWKRFTPSGRTPETPDIKSVTVNATTVSVLAWHKGSGYGDYDYTIRCAAV